MLCLTLHTMSQVVGGTAAKPAGKRGFTGRQWLLIASPALLIVVGLVWWAASGGGDGNPQAHVQSACEQAVKAKLKAPASASFHTGATESKPGIWQVVGDVDATNSFGGSVRSEFTCTVVWQSDKTAEVVGINVK